MIAGVTFSIGATLVHFLHFVGGMSLLTKEMWQSLRSRPFYPKLITEQMSSIGVSSLPLVLATALSTGMVMALQFGFGLERFGGKYYVPKVVSLSLVRELGPVFTSLMLAGRVGAGITAEIGSMNVTQQIDAIRALGTSPLKKIVIPRVIAAIIVLPLLTVMANFIGIAGAMIICVSELGLDPYFFYQKVVTTITFTDFAVGVAKTFFFAAFISLVGCYYGMTTTGGTQGVGIATTKSVVTSSILIVISDFFLTKLFWIFERWYS
ncbi:MAG: ABC transporter permease [Oligoflexia bacterium]|nr:ABC transporter permease [Oligoflexia bacterium]